VFICPHLRLKEENLLTADDKGLTLIHAEVELPSSLFHLSSSKMETIAKVTATEAALKLINHLKTQPAAAATVVPPCAFPMAN